MVLELQFSTMFVGVPFPREVQTNSNRHLNSMKKYINCGRSHDEKKRDKCPVGDPDVWDLCKTQTKFSIIKIHLLTEVILQMFSFIFPLNVF